MSTFHCRWKRIIWSSTARVILRRRCRGQLASLQVATMFVYAHCGAVFSLNFSVHHAVPYMLGKLLIPTFQCFLNHLIWSSVAQVILVGSIPLACLVAATLAKKLEANVGANFCSPGCVFHAPTLAKKLGANVGANFCSPGC